MSLADHQQVEAVIEQVKKTGQEIIISLGEYSESAFRNLYDTANNHEQTLDVAIVERGKSFKIFKV